jgi:hypothetical protein
MPKIQINYSSLRSWQESSIDIRVAYKAMRLLLLESLPEDILVSRKS